MIRLQGAGVDHDDATLLEAVDLRLEAGESATLRGPNGSGKTTLLRILAGRLAPTRGSVEVFGAAPDSRSGEFRRRVAAGIDLPPFARELTVREQAAMIAMSWGIDREAAEARADAVLADLDAGMIADRFPHELSSGQTQLAALALVLVRPFDLLLLDEPEQRLDADRVGLLGDALRALQEEGRAIVLASHSEALTKALDGARIELKASPGANGETEAAA
ncbi:ATP-binding cassette domain-containing protein [Gulosibacter sp. 10]|uniref:ABC transporter ATP-binding protein n=1 Tax=Gulosibacter sp. 10 TaxID=1255570 RepID=UPI00097F590A|nr:ATP-binding cassette domain-containing protein [Gulosibacter sp. 10]SJM49128.1 ABC transporter ATP-binding protein [Gulosibacter sp. 10]